jgi:hypothetical protein
MSVKVSSISFDEYLHIYQKLNSDMRIWYIPSYIIFYEDVKILIAKKGDAIVGIWIVPMLKKNDAVCAERNYRYFPYCAPLIFEKDNLATRNIIKEFFVYLQKICQYIEIPMDTYTSNISIIQSLGAVIELRHTHVLESKEIKLTSRLKNHINYAARNTSLVFGDSIDDFKFDIAIRGSLEEINKRKSLATQLISEDKGIIISAKNLSGILVAGVFIMLDSECAYWMHTWQESNSPRGIIALLVKAAVEYTFDVRNLKKFDFEGSVMQNVDYFFSGFNANIISYGYIHWSKDEFELLNLVLQSRNIEGRLINED